MDFLQVGLVRHLSYLCLDCFGRFYCQVCDGTNQIVSNVIYCQICDFVDNIVLDVVFCQIFDFVDYILTLVSHWTERINSGVI